MICFMTGQVTLNCRGGRQIAIEDGFYRTADEDVFIGRARGEIKNESCRENFNLEQEQPVVIELMNVPSPESMTAMYMFNEWWTRPAFIHGFDEIPEKTQIIFMKYRDEFGALLLLAGSRFKSYAVPGTKDKLRIVMTAHRSGIRAFDEPVLVFAQEKSIYEAVRKVMEAGAGLSGIPLRERRCVPEMFKYLGWCSWDAFYKEISGEKVREKALELKEKNVPVRWMLMDDGWMTATNECLEDFVPDSEKFPGGFAPIVSDIKKHTDIRWMGLWHALGGYWGGVAPGSRLAVTEKDYLYETAGGKLVPSPVDEKGYGFYRDWYNYLAGEGIDFTKVDGQSAVRFYFEDCEDVCKAARGLHGALESGAARMNGAVINCMGMAVENLFARPVTAVSRNSDDFVPDREDGFAEHLIQNAYNAVYHNELYMCDWDMFWTNHPDGIKHSLLRAVSGGPVYFSDRIGDTVKEVVEPLCYSDGELIQWQRSAKAAQDCIFDDPLKTGIIKLTNICTYGSNDVAGAVAVFNLSDKPVSCKVTAKDIYDLPRNVYWIYDYFQRSVGLCSPIGALEVSLPPGGCGWYLMVPAKDGDCQALGLLDKYMGLPAVLMERQEKRSAFFVLREGGNFGFICYEKVSRVLWNGVDVTENLQEVNDNLWSIQGGKPGEVSIVQVKWKA